MVRRELSCRPAGAGIFRPSETFPAVSFSACRWQPLAAVVGHDPDETEVVVHSDRRGFPLSCLRSVVTARAYGLEPALMCT